MDDKEKTTKEGFGTGQRGHHGRLKPVCCDSVMEISSFPESPRSLTIRLATFIFREDLRVSP